MQGEQKLREKMVCTGGHMERMLSMRLTKEWKEEEGGGITRRHIGEDHCVLYKTNCSSLTKVHTCHLIII